MKGFNNIGNTCYLNAGLQMLIQNNDFCDLIYKYSNKSNILNQIYNFIIEYNDNENKTLSPIIIKNIIESDHDMFKGSQQHDSSEFVLFFLDIINKEINKINKDDNISKIFGIDFNIRVKCKLLKCLNLYYIKETSNVLILDINENMNTLNDLYLNFKNSEKIENYYCEKCNKHRIASKKTKIINYPNHLFIWIKRFKQNGERTIKNSKKINIPLYWKQNLLLEGAIIHSGSLYGGHYIYVGKKNNKWYMFNDNFITEIKNDHLDEILSNAYWLYYKKNDEY